ncbi:MAG: DinB family protein [Planctomycetota bacterium]
MTPRSPWSTDELARLDDNGSRLERVLQRLGPDHWDRPIGDGWTVKQMLAHLAFWEETTLPVIETMLRGGPELPADRWYGGDTLRLGPDDPWPDADSHNTREASWADHQTAAVVLDRWRQARHRLKQLVATVTEPEALGDVGDHLTQAREHTEHHAEQLEAMA